MPAKIGWTNALFGNSRRQRLFTTLFKKPCLSLLFQRSNKIRKQQFFSKPTSLSIQKRRLSNHTRTNEKTKIMCNFLETKCRRTGCATLMRSDREGGPCQVAQSSRRQCRPSASNTRMIRGGLWCNNCIQSGRDDSGYESNSSRSRFSSSSSSSGSRSSSSGSYR